jgi:hypothetical protein
VAPEELLSPGLLLALALAPADAATVKVFAFDAKGKALDGKALAARLARADEKDPWAASLPLWARPLDEKIPAQRAALAEQGKLLTLSWEKGEKVRFELVWPVEDDGYNAVVADKGGEGFGDGEVLFLNEELASTQYRLFREAWKRRTTDYSPLYKPGAKAKDLAEKAKADMADAQRQKEAPARAKGFEKALSTIALAWEKMLFEHGLQMALDERRAKDLRFGLTIDDSLLKRLDDVEWVAEAARRSGSNWVRVVFAPNPKDFLYTRLPSFNEYDHIIDELKKQKLRVMGCVLDTAQWPKSLTPELYAERVKSLVLHYKGKVDSWEVGAELNGDWLGGASAPFSPEEVFKIYSAGASRAKELVPEAEVVATLYAWEQTAPDRAHSLSGWLKTFVPRGFGSNLDVVGLSVQPEDNPAGMGFERLFEVTAEALPRHRLMLSSLGYVEGDKVSGYHWLDPKDVDGGRKDLLILYTTASCAFRASACGGFWWQTLDQMLPPGRQKATDLYKVYRRSLEQLGRRE